MTGNATIYKNSQGDNICSTRDEISQPSRPFSPRADTDNQVSCQHLFWSGGWDASPASPPVSAPAANVHFHFPLRNLQPQTCGLMYKFHEEMHEHWKCGPRLEGLRIFHSKNVGEPIEYSRCLPLPCFNKFVLTQKNFNFFVRYKTIQTLLCKDRRWCPDEAPMFWSPT